MLALTTFSIFSVHAVRLTVVAPLGNLMTACHQYMKEHNRL